MTQIRADLGPATAGRTRNWKFRSLEVWRLGGATEVEARVAALGGDEAERCAAITKDTKNQGALKRPGEQSVQARSAKPSTATERAGAKRQTFHGHRTRGKRATGEAAVKAKLPSL